MYERSKKIEVQDIIEKTDVEDKDTVLDFLAHFEVYGYLKKRKILKNCHKLL